MDTLCVQYWSDGRMQNLPLVSRSRCNFGFLYQKTEDAGQRHFRQGQFVLIYITWGVRGKAHAGGQSLKHVKWVAFIPNSVASGPSWSSEESVQSWGLEVDHWGRKSCRRIFIIKSKACRHILMSMEYSLMSTCSMVWMWTFGCLDCITTTVSTLCRTGISTVAHRSVGWWIGHIDADMQCQWMVKVSL